MKWFFLATILATSSVSLSSEASGKDTPQLEPSWECARSCWVPFSYLMAQKYRLVGRELIIVGWARRIDRRLFFFQTKIEPSREPTQRLCILFLIRQL